MKAASKKPSRSLTALDSASSRARPPGGRWTGSGIGRRLAPRVEVAQADDVEVVVGVHVADDDAGQVVRIQHLLQVADHALAAVEQDRGRAPFDEVAGSRCGGVRSGRAAAEHGQPEARAQRVASWPSMLSARLEGWCVGCSTRLPSPACWSDARSSSALASDPVLRGPRAGGARAAGGRHALAPVPAR